MKSTTGFLIGILILLILMAFQPLFGDDQLLFLEGQLVGGYSSLTNGPILYSHHAKDSMQKPSLGFDYIRKFNNGFRDTGTLAVQYRVAYNESIKPRFESQIYNLYYKHKLPGFDLWMGSNRPAAGLSSYLDNHAALLPDMTMKVFTFDRDWGAGLDADRGWIRFAASATNGAGMRIYNKKGNYMLAARIGIGDFNKSNYTLGLSGIHGKVLEAMGYNLGHANSATGEYTLHPEDYIGADGSLRYLNYFLKFDALSGQFYNQPARALLVRTGFNLLSEDRLSLEAQYLYSKHAVFNNANLAASVTYRITPDLALRALFDYDLRADESKIVGQIYYYKGLGL